MEFYGSAEYQFKYTKTGSDSELTPYQFDAGLFYLSGRNKTGRSVNAGQFASTGNHAAAPHAIPVQLPAAPLLTPGGGDDETEKAVRTLQTTSRYSSFSGYVSTYGNRLAAGTSEDSAETAVHDLLKTSGTKDQNTSLVKIDVQ
jgi:hypothetical protein